MNTSQVLSNPDVIRRSAHVIQSYRARVGRDFAIGESSVANLLGQTPPAFAKWLYELPAVVLCHDGSNDPLFNYANLAAQKLFEYSWETFLTLHSRQSAERDQQPGRSEMLQRALRDGFIADYSGVRIAASGRRFSIKNAIIWNVADDSGTPTGQAAVFDQWTYLSDVEAP